MVQPIQTEIEHHDQPEMDEVDADGLAPPGTSTGIRMNIAGSGSMKMPMMSRKTLIIIRMIVGSEESEPIQTSERTRRARDRRGSQPKPDDRAMMNITRAVSRAVRSGSARSPSEAKLLVDKEADEGGRRPRRRWRFR